MMSAKQRFIRQLPKRQQFVDSALLQVDVVDKNRKLGHSIKTQNMVKVYAMSKRQVAVINARYGNNEYLHFSI